MDQKREERGLGLGAIDECQSLLGPVLPGRQSVRGQGGPGRDRTIFRIQHHAFAHQREGQMTERGQVTTGTNAALLRHQRGESRVERRDQRLRQRVVRRQLFEVAAAEKIGARISDVPDD